MLRDYFSLAIESLRTRKLRTWLTMIGIFIGIAAIVSLISLGQGMKDAITSQFATLGSDKITIQAKGIAFGPPGTNVIEPLTRDQIHVVDRVQGVQQAASRTIETAFIEFDGKSSVAFLVDVPSDPRERNLILEVLKPKTVQGRWLVPSDKYRVVVGNEYATKPILGKEVKAGDNIKIKGINFEIVGVMEKKGLPMFDYAILVNEDALISIMDDPEKVSVIVAQVNEGESIEKVSEAISKELRRYRDEEEDKEGFTVSTPQETIRTVSTILTAVQAVLIGIAAISLLVGGIGIMNTMYTSVLERTKEIGIMKAIGAKNSDVLQIFLIESGMLGLLGGTIGVMLGIGISKAVEAISTNLLGSNLLQASITPWLVIGALFFSFIVGTLSGVLPAKQASKMMPVQALRAK